MTYDGSDRKQVREAEKAAKQAEANRHAYTRQIMSDRFGRKWMHDLLFSCHIWSTSFASGQPDVTAFRLGEQNIGLQIFADVIAAAPAEYVQMMSEASIKEEVNVRRNSDDRDAPGERSSSEDPGRDDQGRIASEYDPFVRTES